MPSQAVRDIIPDLPPEIMIVSNVRVDGKPLGLAHDGEMWFHSDMCYAEVPHTPLCFTQSICFQWWQHKVCQYVRRL